MENEIMNVEEVSTDIVETTGKSGSNMGIGILIGAGVVLGVNALYKLGKKGVAYYKAKKQVGSIQIDPIDSGNAVK